MYRIKKVLNHNTIIGIQTENHQEYLIMGKGIGFGKKVSERVEAREEDAIYSLQASTDRGDARELVKEISPECLEIANEVLDEAEKIFGKIDRSILFPMADHIEFAIKRMKNGEQISNPLTEDIRILFHMEFKAASFDGRNRTDTPGTGRCLQPFSECFRSSCRQSIVFNGQKIRLPTRERKR